MWRLSQYKFKANALQFVVYIVVIVAILLSMLLLYIHLNTKFIAQSNAQIEAIELSNQGMHQSLESSLNYGDTLTQEFENLKSIKLFKQHWGVFDMVKSFAKVRDKTFEKVALLGGKTPFDNHLALYLQDNNQSFVLVGDTKINGNAFLGVYGAKPGQISGISYLNNQLIYGEIKNSGFLPNLSLEKQNYLSDIKNQYNRPNSILDFFETNTVNKLQRSFFGSTDFYFSTQSISLFNKNYSGQIIIKSSKKIYVDSSSKLKNVILIAPTISIGQNFKGSLQAFATDQIEVASGVELEYPSALLLNPKNSVDNSKIPNINIESKTEINGVVAYLKGNNAQLEKNIISHITVKENATVNGQIFCEYNLNLQGNVNGHVITNQFLTPYRGSYYINHVFDVNINSAPVSPDFSGLLFQSNAKNIASWLN